MNGRPLSKTEIERTKYPESKSFYTFIYTDDKSHIYIRKWPSKEIEANLVFDVFNKEGYYLYEVESSRFPLKIKNGYLYTVKADPDTGYYRIKRYRIGNWDQLKERIQE